ncbi:hypothetical protein TNCV_780581 [Trichonephila clavipes]|nr:hypothetical protein TNCV_780581 [Trichonephila clavipes]
MESNSEVDEIREVLNNRITYVQVFKINARSLLAGLKVELHGISYVLEDTWHYTVILATTDIRTIRSTPE